MSVYLIDENGRVTQVSRRIPREEAEALLHPRTDPPDDQPAAEVDDPGDEGKDIPPAAAHAVDESGAEFNQRRRGLHSGRLGRWAGQRVPVNG